MVMAKRMISAGIPAIQARAVNGGMPEQISLSLTGAGSTQATALALVADLNIFTTVAAGTGGILQADATPGDAIAVINLGANALLIYPSVGGTIHNLAQNAGFSVTSLKTAWFEVYNVSAGGAPIWYAWLSA